MDRFSPHVPSEKMAILWLVRIPNALPSLASGIKIAAVAAPIGAVIGEWVGASRGLGFFNVKCECKNAN